METTRLSADEVRPDDSLFEPTLQEPFASNPFRVLVLGAGAAPAVIQAALAKARIDARLSSSVDPETALDIVRRAQTELLDPGARARHAAEWFYSPPAFLFAGSFIAETNGSVLPESFNDGAGGAHPQDLANWYLALAVHSRDAAQLHAFIQSAVERWSAIPAPGSRAGSRWQTQAVSQIPEHVVSALSTASTRWLAADRAELAITCVDALGEIGVPSDQVLRVAENALTHQAQLARSELRNAEASQVEGVKVAHSIVDAATPLFELLTALGEDAPSQYQAVLHEICVFLREMAVRLHNEKTETRAAIDIVESALGLASGAIEEKLREDLSELNEQLQQLQSYENYTSLNVSPIKSAPTLFSIYGCGFQLYGGSEHDSFSSSYAANYYFTVFWIPIFPLARYRVRSAGDKSYLFLGKVPFRQSEKWHLIIGLIATAVALAWIAVAAAANDDSGGSSGSYVPPRSNFPSNIPVTNPIRPTAIIVVPTVALPPLIVPTNVPFIRPTATPDTRAAERERLRGIIDANKTRITQLGSQVDQLDVALSNVQTQVSSLKSQMDALLRTYSIGNSLPEPQYSQYERLRAQYNSLIDQYNSTLAQRNSVAKQHDDLLAETNRLVDQYNAIR